MLVWHLQSKEMLIHETGIMKLVDFGLTKTLPFDKDGHFDLQSTSEPESEAASYRYMAPEVLRHEPYNYKVGPRGTAPGFS